MTGFTIESVLNCRALLGECPVWSEDDQCLYWLDIETKTVNRFNPATGINKSWAMAARPGCMGLRQDGGLIIAAQDGIYDLDFDSNAVVRLAGVPFDSEVMRFNDGQVDRNGHLWAGTQKADMHDIQPDEGVLYRFDGESLVPGIDPITVANGTAFSPDGRTLYRSETNRYEILAYDYDPDARTVSNERVFARVPEELGMPDGATVDSEGHYWSALPNPFVLGRNGSIVRFSLTGQIDLQIEMPISIPTMIAFGGPDLSTLYITSVADELLDKPDPSPLSGNLFAIKTPYRGLAHTKIPVSKPALSRVG